MNRKHQRGLAILSTCAMSFAGSSVHAVIYYNPIVTHVGSTESGTGSITTIEMYAHSVPAQAAPVAAATYNSGNSGTRLVTTGLSADGALANSPAITDAAAKGLPFVGTGYAWSGGYDAPAGTPGVFSTAANVGRAVGSVDVGFNTVSNATVVQTQTMAQAYASVPSGGGTIRAAVGNDNGTALWTAGLVATAAANTGSFRAWNPGAGTSTRLDANVNLTSVQRVEIMNGKLFGMMSSGPANQNGIWVFDNGIPTTSGQTATLFLPTNSSTFNPEEFVLIDDPNNPVSTTNSQGFDTAYLATNGNVGQEGIQKWTWNGAAWSQAYVISSVDFHGLAGQLDADTGEVYLWATPRAGTSLLQFTDLATGGSKLQTDTSLITLATIPAGTRFDGVALAPIPEPAILGLVSVGFLSLAMRRRRSN